VDALICGWWTVPVIAIAAFITGVALGAGLIIGAGYTLRAITPMLDRIMRP